MKAIVGIIPALVIGALFGNRYRNRCRSADRIGALIIGGIVLIFLDNRRKQEKFNDCIA